MDLTEVLKSASLTAAAYTQLIEAFRTNHGIREMEAIMREMVDTMEAVDRQGRLESYLGIPVSEEAVAYLRSRQQRVEVVLS